MDNILTCFLCLSAGYLLCVVLFYLFDTNTESDNATKAINLTKLNTILNYTYLIASEYEENEELRETILDLIDDIDDLIIEDRIKFK